MNQAGDVVEERRSSLLVLQIVADLCQAGAPMFACNVC